jgi:hypothetical protein
MLIIPSSWGSQLDGEKTINTVPHHVAPRPVDSKDNKEYE